MLVTSTGFSSFPLLCERQLSAKRFNTRLCAAGMF
jgi:hypothetical protein